MEAGGYDPHAANLRAVSIHRIESGKMKIYKVNLQDVLDGKTDKLFYLQHGDIVDVPERFQMF
jgi:hypothetical protein